MTAIHTGRKSFTLEWMQPSLTSSLLYLTYFAYLELHGQFDRIRDNSSCLPNSKSSLGSRDSDT